jgi:DNA polymerase III alpha subunit
VYDLAKKNQLTPILGVEAYFRDDNCPILLGAGLVPKEYAKYFHITLHAIDQAAYEALSRVLSRAAINRSERHGSEEKPLFNWADLEELAKYNITFTTGCLIGMVQRHYLLGRDDLAQAYFNKLKGIVPEGNLYVELFPHHTDKNWVSGVFVTLVRDSGTIELLRYYAGKKIRVNGVEVEAGAYKFKDGDVMDGVKNYRKWDETFVPGKISSAKFVEEFIENECIPGATDSDSQKWTNRNMIQIAQENSIPMLISDDAHFATPDEKVIQDVRLMAGGDSWRFYASYHRFSSQEAFDYFSQYGMSEEIFSSLVESNIAWADRFKNFSFQEKRELPTKFYPEDTLGHIRTLIAKHGRMDWGDEAYQTRLRAEIQMLHLNGAIDLLPYFMVDEEVTSLYRDNGLLTGPGRGSAAGLLLSYLLGITHVDPLKYGLSLERFLTLDRIKNGKLPDIDQDLPHRDLLVDPSDPNKGWLKERFGDCVAQISTDTKLKLRSSIKDVSRVKHGKVLPAIEALTKGLENAPQGVDDYDFVFGYEGPGGWVDGSIERDKSLKSYIEGYPSEWALVQKLLGLSRQRSRHACGFVLTNTPVGDFIPLMKIGEHVVTQYDSKGVEAAGGLKMDFLTINILNDISEALKLIALGHSPGMKNAVINGKMTPAIRQVFSKDGMLDIWDLPADNGVYADICRGDTETVFQLNTNTAKPFLRLFNFQRQDGRRGLNSIEDLAAFTALGRPGPLDAMVTDGKRSHNMLVEFANRAKGEEPIGAIKVLDYLLPETYGVIVYQEQLQKIFQKLGNTTAVEADEFRVHIGKKMMAEVTKDREVFMRGAVEAVGQEVAEQVWSQMFTFGQYGFNKSVDGDTILELVDGTQKAIKDISPGDKILGVDENGEIVHNDIVELHDHGELEGFEVEFDDGSKVVCSINHKFLTKNGMEPLWKIQKEGSEVLGLGPQEKKVDG